MKQKKVFFILALLLMTATGAWAQDGGTLNGKFTINASGDKVYFAQGNLQAVCTSADGNAATPETFTWRFAEHQWDYIGGTYQDNGEWAGTPTSNNLIDGNGSVSAAGTVDLFSWVGASSTLTGTAAYGLTNAWVGGTDGTGNNANDKLKSDWGNLFGDGWFTLSGDEWAYLLNTRSTTSGVRFAKAYVNSVAGIIVLPDDWSTSYYALNSTNTASVGFDANVISSADWTSSLEAHDAVFLPIAGLRSWGSIWNIGGQGFYWTSTSAADVNCACALTFHATAVEPQWSDGVYRGYGMSVRLVKDALKVTGVTLSQTEAALVVGETLALTPTVAPADAKDKSVTWTTSDGSVATVANGVVTAQGAGTATITVTTTDGAKTATCTVSVTAAAPIAATSAVGTKGFFTDANGQTRLGIVVMLGGEKYAIALSNETDLTGLSGTYTKKVGDYTYYNFADACAKFANNLTDGSYTASNVWRLPTAAEFTALKDLGGSWNGTGYTWTIGGNSLFLPAAGYIDASTVSGVGYYWSSTQPQFLYFNNNGSISMINGGTSSGMPLRLFCRLPDIVETSYVGKVIAADGRMYKTVADANKYSTASGIVAYFGTSVVETGQEYKGIAISLDNMQYNPDYMLYCGYEDKSCSGHAYSDFATALTVKDGIATNAAVLATNADHGYSHQVASVPGANTSPRPAGASGWAVPSIGQWNLIMRGLTGYDLTQTANAALSAASVNAKLPTDATGFSQTLYWSNTEKDNKYVWVMQFTADGGLVSTTNKTTYVKTNYCRPMFAFTSAALACIVSYDANGGSDAPDEQVGDGGGTLTLSTTKPTREGYNFAGWNTAADGSGTTYAAGAELAVDNDVTLYAQWTEKIAKTLEETTDNQTWLATNDGKIYDVTLTRTLQTGGWNTFCAPFSTATPSGWTVKELTGSAFNSTTGELTLTFDAASSIEAGKPYLVKVDANVANPTFNGVTISNTTTTTETTAADFVPVVNPTNLTGGDKTVLFVTGGNKLTYPSADGNINGFRAYFKLKDEVAAQARAFRMSFDDDATGIVTVLSGEPTTTSGTYTLDGRRIEGEPTQKGVYIVNGKKTIIK